MSYFPWCLRYPLCVRATLSLKQIYFVELQAGAESVRDKQCEIVRREHSLLAETPSKPVLAGPAGASFHERRQV